MSKEQGKHGARFMANDKDKTKWEKMSEKEKKAKQLKRWKKANNRCVDCGKLITPKRKEYETIRCRGCKIKVNMEKYWKTSKSGEAK